MPDLRILECTSCGGPLLLLELRHVGLCPACLAPQLPDADGERLLAGAKWSAEFAEDMGVPFLDRVSVLVHRITATNPASDPPKNQVQIVCFGMAVHGIPFDWPGPFYRHHYSDGSSIELLDVARLMMPGDESWRLLHRWHPDRPERWDWWTEARGWIDVSVTLDPLKGDERKTANQALKALMHHQETRGGRRSVGGYADGWEALRAVTDAISRYPGIPRQQDVADRLWADDLGKDDKAIRRLFDNLITPTTGKTWDEVKHGG